jgi:hypothetical protein
MIWHTGIGLQRFALSGESGLPCHGRPVEPRDSGVYQGIRRE